jgi:serine/threonine-protein kinase HipA
MKQHRCLYCYEPLSDETADFHEKCSRSFFGTPVPPVLDYDNDQMQELAKQIVIKNVTIPGVQPKLSVEVKKDPNDPMSSRLTIVGLWGNYILKPPTHTFPHLPENEDLSMHLSELAGISTAQHSLIRLKSGELAYITKRFDRQGKSKLGQEDMCQLTETLTEDKYRSSMEKVGKHILKYSSRPGLDAVTFFELSVFCFLIGNADMHLKNFALLTTQEREVILSPAYDLVSTKVAMPKDMEEMALTINGRKRKIQRSDFMAMAKSLEMVDRAAENVFTKIGRLIPKIQDLIGISFMPSKEKSAYKKIVQENAVKLNL